MFSFLRNGGARLFAPAIAAAVVLAYLMGAALAARAADEPVTFFGCLDDKGNLADVTTNQAKKPSCGNKETAVSWNQTGPQGVSGPAGLAGPAGGIGAGAPNKVVVGRVVIQGITGDAGVDVFGYRTGEKNTPATAGGGGGGGKVQFDDLAVTLGLTAVAPKLQLAGASGQHIPAVTLQLYRAGTTAPEMTYKLTDVVVTGVADSHTGAAGDAALEAITLNFGRIQWAHTAADGSTVTGGWDVKANTSIP